MQDECGPAIRSWSTSAVEPERSFEYWRDMICDTFVQLAAAPVGDRPFAGRIDSCRLAGLEVSTVRAGAQRVRRTPSLIARGNESFLLASIQVRGSGLVVQDGRTAVLEPGAVAFYDSTRPYTLHFGDGFEQIVVQVPLERALALAGTRRPLDATAVTLAPDGYGGIVGGFFGALADAQRQKSLSGVDHLAEAGTVLLAAALSFAGGGAPAPAQSPVLCREQVVAYLRQNLRNPRLDAGSIAAALHVSPRTLFRIFAGEPEGVAGLLRRMRIEHAKGILRRAPATPLRQVAVECGFAGETQFYRVFRAVVGQTPGEFRAAAGGA